MKSARVAYGLVALGLFFGCARSPEASPPAASSDATATRYAAPPGEAAQAEAPAPSPAAAPQGLTESREEAEKPKAQALDEFKNLEAAERALAQAKSDLDRLAMAEPAPVVGRSRAADSAAEKKDDKSARTPSASGAGANAPPNGLCENACRAFSSLSRAASAVCRLDNSSAGSHCMRAKKVVADSQQRVASCSCPAPKD